jgi:hypothetical protein
MHPKMRLTPQSLPTPQTQAPSPPSSFPCPENAQRRRPAKPTPSGFAGLMTTTRKPWCSSNRVPLCLGYPVHRSLPPTRRSSSDESLVPGKTHDKPLNPHANLSVLRATRTASESLLGPRYVGAYPPQSTISSAPIRSLIRPATMHRTEYGHSTGRRRDGWLVVGWT